MNLLVVAPHPDDEAIGCGGVLCLHTARGDRVTAVFLTSGELGLKHLPREQAQGVREAEAAAAAEVLGLARLAFLRLPDWFVGERTEEAAAGLQGVLEQEAPELVYVPHERDDHPDHRVALTVVRLALKGVACPSPVLATYEVWTPLPAFDRAEDVSAVMARKMRAVRCHRSQVGHFRYDRAVRGLNQFRGALAARCRYAEVFRNEEVALLGGGSTPAGG